MAAATKDVPRDYEDGNAAEYEVPMAATSTIYEGSVVGATSGFARALVAGDVFQGFAARKCVNAGAAGAALAVVHRRGVARVALASAAATDLGASIYASDDSTFTKTSSSNTLIGKVIRVDVAAGMVYVDFHAGR